MHNLRIALLSMHSCPWSRPGGRYTGGMNIYVQNLSRELGKLGASTDIFTCSHHGDELCGLCLPSGNVRLIHLNAGCCDRVKESGQAGYAGSLAQDIDSYRREMALRYDLIHSHYWLSGLAGNRLKELWGVPHISMFHTLGALKNGSPLGAVEPASRIYHERAIIDACDRVIASTAAEKGELVNRYGAPADRVSVIPCGVDVSLFRPVDRQAARTACGIPDKKTLLFVGRPDPIKGLENLLRAASMIDRVSDFQLLVIGCDNRYTGEWRQGAEDGRDRVIFAGPVEHEKMHLYYNAADLCVIPSYYESFCLTALESVACGTPVLATPVGEIPQISRLSALCKIIPDNSPAGLAQHIGNFLAGNGQDAGRPGPELSLNYGWDAIARRITREYEEVCSTPVFAARLAAR